MYVEVREGNLRRTNSSENCLGTGITLGMAFNPPIDPNDANDPGEMIEAAEHKVDSVSHFVWCMVYGKNDSCQQHCSQGGLTVRVQLG